MLKILLLMFLVNSSVSLNFVSLNNLSICEYLVAAASLTKTELLQNGLFIVSKLTVRFNEALCNISINMINDGIHDTLMNVTVTTFVEVKKVLLYLSIKLPESSNDKQYKREFLKTSFDIEKLFNGIFSNFIGRAVMENFKSTANFELKFPFKPARTLRLICCVSILTCLFLQRDSYRITNLTLNEKFIPPMVKPKNLSNLRFIAKIPTQKSMVFVANVETFTEIHD